MGIRDDHDMPVNECSAINDTEHGGRKHYWAPFYKTSLKATASDDYLMGQTTPAYEIHGYSTDDNTIKFYKVANHWCRPAMCLQSYSYDYYSPDNIMAIPGATFNALSGEQLIINSDDHAKLLSECDPLPLIIPGIAVYAITCTQNGSQNNYRNPLPGSGFLTSKTIGRDKFTQDWDQYVGLSCPVPLKLFVGGAWGPPVAGHPTGFKYKSSSTASSVTTENYNQGDNGFAKPNWNVNYKTMIGLTNCMTKTLTFSPTWIIEEVDAGQLLADTNSPEYHYQNATHFQCGYAKADATISNGERFWGYLYVIDEVKLEMTTLI